MYVRVEPFVGDVLVLSVGIDLVEIHRIEQAVERYGAHFLDKVFTKSEQNVYQSGGSCERLAARFAAKEAVMKVLGTGWASGVTWLDIEVISRQGRPYVVLSGRTKQVATELGIAVIHISLTHAQTTAGAVAVGETETWSSTPKS